MLANIVGGFVVILVGVNLAGPVGTAVQGAIVNATGGTSNTNITGASATILGLTTLFYCLAIASVGIGITTVGLKNSGLM